MKFQKGNKLGGRKGFGQEVNKLKEEITKDVVKKTIEELAEEKVFEHLGIIDPKKDRQGVKEIALPIYIKSKPEKRKIQMDINEFKQYTDEELRKIASGEGAS